MFIPFLGAYVKHTRGNPWQTARVAIAGPILGGARVARLLPDRAAAATPTCCSRSRYFGFFLNLFNLLPFGILDGGAVWRSTRWLWHGGGREQGDRRRRSSTSAPRLLLALGHVAAHIPQHRL